jgi:hypothetical protein
MHDVMTFRKMQKLVRLLSVCDSFKVFVRLKVDGDDYVRTPTANSFYVKSTSPILDLRNCLFLR